MHLCSHVRLASFASCQLREISASALALSVLQYALGAMPDMGKQLVALNSSFNEMKVALDFSVTWTEERLTAIDAKFDFLIDLVKSLQSQSTFTTPTVLVATGVQTAADSALLADNSRQLPS